MDSGNFFLLLYNNVGLYALSLLISLVVFFLVYKRYFISIWDPILVSLVFSALACATPIFLFFLNKISDYYFFVFLITQTSFLLGILFFRPLKISSSLVYKISKVENEAQILKIFFALIFSLHFLIQFYLYVYNGIPIFMYSKLEIYEAEASLQFANRLVTIYYPFLSFCTIYFFLIKKSKALKAFTYISGLWLIISGILSASKGFFLILGESVFILMIFYKTLEIKLDFKKFKSLEKKMIFWGTLFALLVIVIQAAGGVNPMYVLAYRLAASGDSYYMSLPDGVIDQLDHGHGLISIFSSPLKMIGLIDESQMPESIGFALVHVFNPFLNLYGPNARHTLIGYLYLGLGGAVVFSFMLGLILSFVRNKLYFFCKKNKLLVLLYFGLLICVSKFEMDYFTAQSYLINLILFVLPVIITSMILAGCLNYKFSNNRVFSESE